MGFVFDVLALIHKRSLRQLVRSPSQWCFHGACGGGDERFLFRCSLKIFSRFVSFHAQRRISFRRLNELDRG